MPSRPPLTLWLPAMGFAVLGGLALLATSRAHVRPEGRLYRAAAAYLADVADGRAQAAAGWAVPPGVDHAAEEAHRRAGQIWAIGGLEVQEEAALGVVEVLWYQADGRPAAHVAQAWVRDETASGVQWRLGGEQAISR